MTGTNIAAYARILTNTNSTTFTDADALTILNVKYGNRILDILKLQVDKNANEEEAYTNLVDVDSLSAGDNGYDGEYAFPTDLLRPLRMEISYDGTNWNRATIYDINENNQSEHDNDTINNTFSESSPYVRFDRGSFYIRPLPDDTISNGIHIWYEKRETELSALSETPDFESNLHDVLAFDLAEVKALNQTGSYDYKWWSNFREMKKEAEGRFAEFYKNQFKKTLRMKPNYESYK